jgi:thymidylate kinase
MSYLAPPDQAQMRWFRGSRKHRHKPRWVGFEGIVASGKTTQTELLAKNCGPSVEVIPEFGNHDLGRYLMTYGSPGMRLTPEGCDTSYVRHLLALSSHMQKLREVGQSKNTFLLDVATLTDTAFALADLPEQVARHLRPTMRSAVNSMIEIVRPRPEEGVLIYLDCAPEEAARRLAVRNGTEVSAEQVEFLVRMRDAYEFLLDEREDFVRVDANRGIDEVAGHVRTHVRM